MSSKTAIDTNLEIPYRHLGVKPMTPGELAGYRGLVEGNHSRSRKPDAWEIRRRAREDGVCYYEDQGYQGVLYPTSATLEDLFDDPATADFELLERHLRQNELRSHMMSPFRVCIAQNLLEREETYNRTRDLKKGMRDVPKLESKKGVYYLINASNAEAAIPSGGSDREERVRRFSDSIEKYFWETFIPGIEEYC